MAHAVAGRFHPQQGNLLKDQITADLLTTGAKVAPPAVVAVASGVGTLNPHAILVWLTIVYTVSLLLTNVVKNWGTWMAWWDARAEDLRVLWRKLRG